ncbi:hypothetical protein SELMODRAFT_441151 [Selaginella moellendorffii]|uniref:C2 domain-containing protein n=1 Tax=Selaginella moellendorffii TaxID=88036 RepID=D8RGY3_SELML|nr:protein SRC2 homolog [Selaginella moellendorffii]EFJ28670.1 hypothetical protein SELMODRAFT_441151 [Selaginella moellendorffii]|eukprot:XP_002970540.1 protein SRC2 homolog [Selaginella moellendorffii]
MTTELRMLEVTPISAEDLKDVKLVGKMQTYVVAWVDPSRKASTNLSQLPGKNPRWNEKLMLSVEDQLLQQPGAFLVLEIYHRGFLESTIVGRANIPLQEISAKGSGDAPLSFKVRRPSGRLQGTIHVSVKVGEKFQGNSSRTQQPAPTAYPYNPQGQGPSSACPQAYPPAAGYPPQQQGMYQQQQQPYYPPAYGAPVMPPMMPPRRNRFGGGGMGMGGAGLGLGAGLLGGLLVGDMINDAHYDGGYGGDYGGGDYGGGDFGGGDFGGGDW